MKKTTSRMPSLALKGGVFMRNIGFLIVFFALFSVFSHGLNTTELAGYYTFDNNFVSNATFNSTVFNGSAGVSTIINTTYGLIGGSAQIPAEGSYINLGKIPLNQTRITINMWIYQELSNTSAGYFGRYGTRAEPYTAISNNDGNLQIFTGDGISHDPSFTTGWVPKQKQWFMFTVRYNSTSFSVFVNGVSNISGTLGIVPVDDTGTDFYLGGRTGLTGPELVGKIDEVAIFSSQISDADVLELYNSGSGLTYPFTSPASPQPSLTLNMNVTSNQNISINPLKIAYNGTTNNMNGSSDIGDAYLYLNGSLNQSQLNVNISNTLNFTLNTTGREEGYNITIKFNNSVINDSIEAINVFIDTILPQVQISSSFSNNSVLFRNLDNLTFILNFSDTNLFAVNFSIFRLNSNLTYTNNTRNITLNNTFATNLTLNATSQYLINWTGNQTFNPTNYYGNWSDGSFEIFGQAWDSHTKAEIKAYKIKDVPDGYNYDNVKIYSQSTKQKWNAKEKDKYRFGFDYNNEGIKDIYLESTGSLFQIENSEYPLHFVDFDNGKWVDFSSQDYESYTIEKQSDKKYKLSFKTKQGVKQLSFNSIGDLNYRNSSWYFNISSGRTFYAIDSVTANAITNFTVWISNSTNTSQILQNKTTGTGNITFNITEGVFYTNISAPTYASNNTGNMTFTYNSTFTYTLYGLNSLSLLFFDEETNAEINGTNLSVKVINLLNLSYSNLTDSGFTYITGFSPGTYEIRYGEGGYRVRSYYTTITSDSSQSINLYTVKNTTSSLIVFSINDEKGQPLNNYTLKVQRYFFDYNAYIVVDMEKTDNNGETSSFLVPNTEPYILVVENQQGVVKFRSSPQKIFSSTVFLRVPILDSAIESLIAVRDDITTNLSYSNATKILSFFWNDASGLVSEGCLIMKKNTFNAETETETCTSSASATITLNMTPHIANNTRFTAYGKIDTNTSHSSYITDIITDFIIERTSYDKFGRQGLFLSYIFIATMFFVGIPISFSVALGYTVISLIVIQIAGISFFGWSLIVTITIVGLIIALVNKI